MGIVKEGNDHFLVVKTKLRTNDKNEIEWLVSFRGGGWNSIWAKPEPLDEAINVAKKEFHYMEIASVRPMTDEIEEKALSNFF